MDALHATEQTSAGIAKPLIEARGLGFKVRAGAGEINILRGIDLSVSAGEAVGIVGPSGSGKTSLLMLLAGLERPTSGSLLIDGADIAAMDEDALARFRRERLGIVFQAFHLIPTMTALENVMAPLFGRKVPYDKKERAEQLLAQVGLADKAGSLPSQLSGGQQQRVAVARALVHEPKWLLADEPTGNLDTDTGEIIFNLLRSLNEEKGCGVLFVTHDPALAERANRTIEMRDGVIIEDRLVRV